LALDDDSVVASVRPATLALSETRERAVAETMRRAQDTESFDYPWQGL